MIPAVIASVASIDEIASLSYIGLEGNIADKFAHISMPPCNTAIHHKYVCYLAILFHIP